ncbi:MAG: ParB/RepB/Spo0J family partition protein [Candidatus Kapabacteria bacterium]|jgi:ParB family chromosome partitioning protein|nr:ParB/RepB/Spo0J family partition protein [Candidatus Kapabacteria bacterium]
MKGGLGKGIGALIPKDLMKAEQSSQQTIIDETTGASSGINHVDIEKITPNPFQPRRDFDQGALEELAASIRVHGVVTPITVRKLFDGYELVSGERRLRASKLAGLTQIPAYVITVSGDAQMLEIAIIENVQRQDLNPLEVAQGYQRLIDECKLRQEDVAVKVGKDRSTVTNHLRLLKLPAEAQLSLRHRSITMGHARALLALSDESAQLAVLNEIRDRDLSVRKTEALVKDLELGRKEVGRKGEIVTVAGGDNAGKLAAIPAELASTLGELENTLRHLFATQVKVKLRGANEGAIEIEFYTLDELERLLELMSTLEQAERAHG